MCRKSHTLLNDAGKRPKLAEILLCFAHRHCWGRTRTSENTGPMATSRETAEADLPTAETASREYRGDTGCQDNRHAHAARVQFVSIEEKAVALFAAGHTYRSAWRILTAEHRLSLSYHAFLRNAQKRLAPEALPGGQSPLTSNAPKSSDAENTDDVPRRAPRSNPDRHRTRPAFHYDPANARREDLV